MQDVGGNYSALFGCGGDAGDGSLPGEGTLCNG